MFRVYDDLVVFNVRHRGLDCAAKGFAARIERCRDNRVDSLENQWGCGSELLARTVK